MPMRPRGPPQRRGRFREAEPKPPREQKKTVKVAVQLPPVKLFGKWDSIGIEVNDPGLRNYITLRPQLLPRSAGIHRRPFHKSKAHIVERLALHMLVPGHRGRKHEITSGKFGGGFGNTLSAVEKALEFIEAKEKKNPIEVFVRALENSAAREEITSYQMGSIVAREAVVTSPQRRVDKALRNFAQGAYRRTFGKKTTLGQALAEEIMAAYKGSNDSFAIKEKERIEREAMGAR